MDKKSKENVYTVAGIVALCFVMAIVITVHTGSSKNQKKNVFSCEKSLVRKKTKEWRGIRLET